MLILPGGTTKREKRTKGPHLTVGNDTTGESYAFLVPGRPPSVLGRAAIFSPSAAAGTSRFSARTPYRKERK